MNSKERFIKVEIETCDKTYERPQQENLQSSVFHNGPWSINLTSCPFGNLQTADEMCLVEIQIECVN